MSILKQRCSPTSRRNRGSGVVSPALDQGLHRCGAALADLDVAALYAHDGRPSIPPERLLKASLLIALYTVRSDRMFCEMLDYNILFCWFLDMNLEQDGLDQSNFSRPRERLDDSPGACRFFDAVVAEALW